MSHGLETLSREFKPTAGVYGLFDPRSGRAMYCGVSIDIDYRFRQHLDPNSYDPNLSKRRWIAGLKALGLAPTLRVLEECPYPASDAAERRWLKFYRARGECELNLASGGRTSRGRSALANSHPDDWFQLGLEVAEAKRLLDGIAKRVAMLAEPKLLATVFNARRIFDEATFKVESALAASRPELVQFGRVLFHHDQEDESPEAIEQSLVPHHHGA